MNRLMKRFIQSQSASPSGGRPRCNRCWPCAACSKSFGAVAALRDVRLDLRPGEAHGLVGENGAGKSTLVKILAGVHAPDAGTVTLDGRAVDLHRSGRRPGRRHRGDLPGADAVPRPVGRGEHLHGPPAAARPAPDRPRGDARRAARSCSPGSACTSTRTGRRAGCPSPTSSSSRSPRRSPSTPGCWSWTSRPRRCPAWRSSGCSRSPGRCGTPARRVLFISHRFDEVFALCQRITVHARRPVGLHRPGRRR